MNKQLSEKDMFDFGVTQDFVKANESRSLYACDAECGEIFERDDIWHCPICHHHWPPQRDDCHNCWHYKPQKHGDLLKAYKSYMQELRKADPAFGIKVQARHAPVRY